MSDVYFLKTDNSTLNVHVHYRQYPHGISVIIEYILAVSTSNEPAVYRFYVHKSTDREEEIQQYPAVINS